MNKSPEKINKNDKQKTMNKMNLFFSHNFDKN